MKIKVGGSINIPGYAVKWGAIHFGIQNLKMNHPLTSVIPLFSNLIFPDGTVTFSTRMFVKSKWFPRLSE